MDEHRLAIREYRSPLSLDELRPLFMKQTRLQSSFSILSGRVIGECLNGTVEKVYSERYHFICKVCAFDQISRLRHHMTMGMTVALNFCQAGLLSFACLTLPGLCAI